CESVRGAPIAAPARGGSMRSSRRTLLYFLAFDALLVLVVVVLAGPARRGGLGRGGGRAAEHAGVWAWGWNPASADAGGANQSLAPTPLPGLDGVQAAASGGQHALALERDGSVWAWGQNLK